MDIGKIYLKESADSIMKEADLWVLQNYKNELSGSDSMQFGTIIGYYYAVKLAKEKLDDTKIDDSVKVVVSGLCYGYCVQINRMLNQPLQLKFKGVAPDFNKLAPAFNGGILIL